MNNIYDKKFEIYLVQKGYDLNCISLNECLKEIKLWKKNTACLLYTSDAADE